MTTAKSKRIFGYVVIGISLLAIIIDPATWIVWALIIAFCLFNIWALWNWK